MSRKLTKTLQFLALGIFLSGSAMAQTAELQVIHNSPDPAADTVDVYVNGAIALPDFAFRTATPFITLPAGVPINIGVAPGNSTSAADTLKNFEVTLANGNRYVAIASGVLNPASFAANPEGKPTGFTLFIKDNVQNSGLNPANVDFFGVHGATDAPAVDIKARGVATLLDSVVYSNVSGYLSVPASNYILDVTPAAGSPIVASFDADLSGLGGGSAVVFASGFLNPAQNQNGEAFGLFAALASGQVVPFPAVSLARLQVIHNAADPGATEVDIYINGSLELDNFAFRAATPFIDVPAGVLINIGVAGPNSTSVNDTLKNFQVTFQNGNTYVAIANGVLDPNTFAANPDGRSTAFTLLLKDMAREASTTPGSVDFFALHGATDAPGVDVVARNVATLVSNAKYSDITGYLTVPAASYILDVTLPGGTPIVASYEADLSALGGGSAVVFASGFLDPAQNQTGEAFGLFAALANGSVVSFPSVSLARLQVIHNAADPDAAAVDIYINGNLELDNFAFRAATPFIDIPAGVPINIGIAGPFSNSANDTIKNFEVTFQNGNTYVAIANGLLNPTNFAVNPDGRSTAFTLLLKDLAREASTTPGSVDFFAVHGATDAPGVDVIARNVATLVSNAKYTDITGYLTVPASSYILDVTLPGGTPIVASYLANLTTLGGGSAVVFASGFLDPAQNLTGEPFGLFAALANGTVVPFPAVSLARLQVIHNAADPAADSVDVYVNGINTLDDFKFRTGTPYIDVPAGVLLNIGVAPGNSTSVNDTLKNFEVTLQNGNTYVAIASGVLNPASFAANPDGRSTGFTLLLKDQMREAALLPGNVDFVAVHGATDIPGVDILTGGTPLVNDIKYSDIQNYQSVPAGTYTLDITPENNNSTILLSFLANLNPFAGKSAVILASGFLTPSANQNGDFVGLLAVFNDGTSALLSNVTGINTTESSNFSIAPNPANDFTTITFNEPSKASVITVSNQLGQSVITENIPAGANRYEISTSTLSKGIYFVKINGEGSTRMQKLIVN